MKSHTYLLFVIVLFSAIACNPSTSSENKESTSAEAAPQVDSSKYAEQPSNEPRHKDAVSDYLYKNYLTKSQSENSAILYYGNGWSDRRMEMMDFLMFMEKEPMSRADELNLGTGSEKLRIKFYFSAFRMASYSSLSGKMDWSKWKSSEKPYVDLVVFASETQIQVESRMIWEGVPQGSLREKSAEIKAEEERLIYNHQSELIESADEAGQAGNLEEMKRHLETLLMSYEKDPRSYNNAAITLAKYKYFADAEAYLKKGQEKFPEDSRFPYSLGLLFSEMKQTEKAVQYLEKSVELKPDFGRAWYNLSFAYQRLGRVDDADRAMAVWRESQEGK